MIYKDFSYFFILDILDSIDKLYYFEKSLFFIYTNEELDYIKDDERLKYYTYGLYNFIKKKEEEENNKNKVNKRSKIFYNLGVEVGYLKYNDFESHSSYQIMNYDNLNNVVKRINDNIFIKRHFKKFLEFITNLKIGKKKLFKVSPYDMDFSCKI